MTQSYRPEPQAPNIMRSDVGIVEIREWEIGILAPHDRNR
jgi:hypothetical protein